MTSDAATIATACGAAMWADDNASRGLGMRLESVGSGSAALSMQVTAAMVNGLGVCHGGFVLRSPTAPAPLPPTATTSA